MLNKSNLIQYIELGRAYLTTKKRFATIMILAAIASGVAPGPARSAGADRAAPQVGASPENPAPALRDYGLKDYVRTSKDLPHSEGKAWKLVCGIPYNCQFQPWIRVESPAGRTISFNSSNPLVLYLTKPETAETVGGDQALEAKSWVRARYTPSPRA